MPENCWESYEDLEKMLKSLPMTWYPALIILMVEAAYAKNVFVPGGASNIVAATERRIKEGKLKSS